MRLRIATKLTLVVIPLVLLPLAGLAYVWYSSTKAALERQVREALRTADTMLDWFWDPIQGGLYTTAEDAETMVVRQKDLLDNATPSANSLAAVALLRLAALTDERRYAEHAVTILRLGGVGLAR